MAARKSSFLRDSEKYEHYCKCRRILMRDTESYGLKQCSRDNKMDDCNEMCVWNKKKENVVLFENHKESQ